MSTVAIADLDDRNRTALWVAGAIDHYVFAYFAHVFELGSRFANQAVQNMPWPRHKPLLRPLRQAIYIDPIVKDLQAAQQEQIDHETGEKLKTAFVAELAKLDAEETVHAAE